MISPEPVLLIKIMRKKLSILFLSLSLFSASAEKGEKYISADFGINFDKKTREYSKSIFFDLADETQQTFALSAGSEFGYFVSNNFKVGCAISGTYNTSLSEGQNSATEIKTLIGVLNPNIAYYFRITDKFSYSPEVGAHFGLGKVDSNGNDANSKFWDIYLKFISFEFRITEKFALGVDFGNINFCAMKLETETPLVTISGESKQFQLNAQGGAIHARFYLDGKKQK